MEIKRAVFVTSAAREDQFITPQKPMIAVCGKSNSGKSTLINMLAGQKKLAKTSADPGRTRLVNYFDFDKFLLADLPGYGYAAVSKSEKEKWAVLLDKFFERKEELRHVFLLSDIRRDPSEDDMQMVAFLNYHIVPFTVILTKSDKLSRMKAKEQKRRVAQKYGLTEANVIAVSGITCDGKDALLARIAVIIE